MEDINSLSYSFKDHQRHSISALSSLNTSAPGLISRRHGGSESHTVDSHRALVLLKLSKPIREPRRGKSLDSELTRSSQII